MRDHTDSAVGPDPRRRPGRTDRQGAAAALLAVAVLGGAAGTAHARRMRPFASIQPVFSASCALPSCHSAVARQGGLVLESEDLSYDNLVGRPPEAPEARAAGLARVMPGDPRASFLVRKLRGLGPGGPMPVGGASLPKATVAAIERWIRRGALPTSAECPAGMGRHGRCVTRASRARKGGWKPERPLTAPPARKGFQVHLPSRTVVPGTEWEMCYAVRPDWPKLAAASGYPAGQLPVIREQVYRMNPGAHHALLYGYFGRYPDAWPTGYFPCRGPSCINPADCPPDADQFVITIGGAPVATTRYATLYPEGVGLPALGANMVLIANVHFTNTLQPPQPTRGETWINFYFYEPDEFRTLLDGIFERDYNDLFVEPYETRSISRIWQPRSRITDSPVDAAIFQLYSHMHKRGVGFQIDYVRGGTCSASGVLCGRDDDCRCKTWERGCEPGQACVRGPYAEDTKIYFASSWDHAPVAEYEKPYLSVKRDQGLRFTCTHTNGIPGDPAHPPKRCQEGCEACGWDQAARTCRFTRGVELGIDAAPRTYREGEPMPLVFAAPEDDDMCAMIGYFIDQADLSKLP